MKKIIYRIEQKAMKFFMRFMDWKEPQLFNSVLELPSFIKSKGISKVLLVTDKGIMNLHLADSLIQKLKEEEIGCFIFDEVTPNPTIPNIEKCRQMYLDNKCEGIIALVVALLWIVQRPLEQE